MSADIFVFGSNEAGRHGAGAALTAAKYHGAIYGQGEGRQGSSYGIPTKDGKFNKLPHSRIRQYVETFKRYVEEHPELYFMLTRVGCGLAGNKDVDIAPMFSPMPHNVYIPEQWRPYIKREECSEK
jgi:hypothetical protein